MAGRRSPTGVGICAISFDRDQHQQMSLSRATRPVNQGLLCAVSVLDRVLQRLAAMPALRKFVNCFERTVDYVIVVQSLGSSIVERVSWICSIQVSIHTSRSSRSSAEVIEVICNFCCRTLGKSVWGHCLASRPNFDFACVVNKATFRSDIE